MTLYPQKDLPGGVHIWHTGISFGYERRRHVGGRKVLICRLFNQKTAGNQAKINGGGDSSLPLLIYLLCQLFFWGTNVLCNDTNGGRGNL